MNFTEPESWGYKLPKDTYLEGAKEMTALAQDADNTIAEYRKINEDALIVLSGLNRSLAVFATLGVLVAASPLIVMLSHGKMPVLVALPLTVAFCVLVAYVASLTINRSDAKSLVDETADRIRRQRERSKYFWDAAKENLSKYDAIVAIEEREKNASGEF